MARQNIYWRKMGFISLCTVLGAVLVGGLSGCTTFKGAFPSDKKKAESKDEEEYTPPEEDQKLVKELKELRKKHKHTTSPAREYVNRANGKAGKKIVNTLTTGEGNLKWRRKQAKNLVKRIKKGLEWPERHTCEAPFVSSDIKIDGRLDDKAWEKAAQYKGSYAYNNTNKTNDPMTKYYVAWDNQYLYFGFDCEDTDILAKERGRDGYTFKDDCVEVYITPNKRFGVYWEIDINPQGDVFDGLMRKKYFKWGASGNKRENVKGLKYKLQVNGTINNSEDEDQGYTAEVAVPFSELPEYSRAEPAQGQELYFIMARLDKNKDDFTAYTYKPVAAWCHNIWTHTRMKLVK